MQGTHPVRSAVATLVAALLFACAPNRSAPPADRGVWLTETGFAQRSGWPSTILHVGAPDAGRPARIMDRIEADPTLEVDLPGDLIWGIRRVAANGRRCELAVYFNGTRHVRRDFGGGTDFEGLLGLQLLDGIEIHAGPARPVLDPTGCGVVLLWSHEERDERDPAFVGTIHGVVRSEAPDSVRSIRVEPGGRVVSPDPQGRVTLSDLLPGPYELVLLGSEGELARHRARVYAYETTEVELTVRRR